MSEIHFIDTTLRDGNQSLWAMNMPIGAMLPIAEQMDHAGFESMEFFVSVMFKKYVHRTQGKSVGLDSSRQQEIHPDPLALSRRHAQRLREDAQLHPAAARSSG